MLNGTDERALKVIEEWRKKQYVAEEQETANLQCLIDEALRQQDLLTRMIDECSNYSDMGSFSDFVDEWIQLNIEIPMAESAGLDKINDSIYDYVDNVNELRDCQNDFVSEILEAQNKDA